MLDRPAVQAVDEEVDHGTANAVVMHLQVARVAPLALGAWMAADDEPKPESIAGRDHPVVADLAPGPIAEADLHAGEATRLHVAMLATSIHGLSRTSRLWRFPSKMMNEISQSFGPAQRLSSQPCFAMQRFSANLAVRGDDSASA